MRGASLACRKTRFGSLEGRAQRGGPEMWVAPRRTGFFGLEVEEMEPRARVVTGLAVLVPVLLSGLMLLAFVPGLWWVFTTYGWVSIPAFGLVARGVAGLSEGRDGSRPAERELLEALRERGELTPTRAAMETSLSVAEADRMLRELAENGHLEVRVRGGALFYALWARAAALEAGAHKGEDSSG